LDETVGVRGVQCGRHLRDDRRRSPRFEGAVREQNVLQVGALDQAHVDVQDPADVTEVVDGNDVRFLQPRRHPRLAPEALLEHRVGGHLRPQHLDRHRSALDRVVGPIDLTHAADTDQGLQLIRPEPGAETRVAVRE
jgi:hypothetical protein